MHTADEKSLLVINKAGMLHRLYAPFKAVCICPVPDIRIHTQVYVEAVIGTTKGELYYIIFKKPYRHYHFHIIIHF